MSKNGIRYDEEFKQELIRLVKEEGRSIPKVAKETAGIMHRQKASSVP
ncbi:hypothetical protein SAMN05192551_1112 [Tindallia magadiensis]|uniref:Transposase n=1 Tax=Tindallia magadiensis TaxID=69895 RepID=A0A1I3GZV4_9FIRM|nr:transposase [Tindallia magadiensis]SFI28959.1 hypothetical protein SAMN05192551_1112 [Tindallia magadiensis]